MPVKLTTTLHKIVKIENVQNRLLVKQYHKFMDSTGASERHQNNNLKVIYYYVNYLGKDIFLSSITSCDSILLFLETKKKTKDEDPNGKWISTWNHYFHRIKHFFRWERKKNIIRIELQENPDILFKNLLVDFIRNDNYQRLIELLV